MTSNSGSDSDTSKTNLGNPSKSRMKNKPNITLGSSDLTLSKSSFQQMLMNFNNKVVNNDKHNFIKGIAPAHSILKKRPSESYSNGLDLHTFIPAASSTHSTSKILDSLELPETPDLSVHKKKHKKKHKLSKTQSDDESLSLSLEKTPVIESLKSKKEKKHKKHTVSDSDEGVIERPKSKKEKKRLISENGEAGKQLNSTKFNLSNREETLSETEVNAQSKLVSVLENFEQGNNLTKSDESGGISKDLTSSRFETFLIQIPKSVDPKTLIGLELSLSDKIRLKYNGHKYYCIPSPTEEPATLLNNGRLTTIHPKVTITVKQHIKRKNLPDIKGAYSNTVAFPDDLKERHPLFGSDYLKNISLEERIREKLKAAVESNERRKKQESTVQSSKPQDEEIFKFLNQSSSESTTKKRKKDKKIKREPVDDSINDDMISQILVSRSMELSSKSLKKQKVRNE